MAAPLGNDYAKKWTEEKALEFIEKVKEILLTTGNYHLQYACQLAGEYSAVWAYLSNLFADNSKVFNAIKDVEQHAEAKIVNHTLSGDIKSTAMAIFYLKNKHGYTDKKEIDANVQSNSLDTWLGQFDNE